MDDITSASMRSNTDVTLAASEVLANFKFPAIELTDTERAEWKDVLFDSIVTEYDARRLYWHMENRYTEHFSALVDVLNPWLRDEIDHAYGFALIYASYSGIPFSQVALEAETRKADFEIVDPIFCDLFKILIMMAYDEIITTHVYHRSIPLYDKFKSYELSTWIRKLKKDEVTHFFSFIRRAKELFPRRAAELPEILDEILGIDFGKDKYTGTFVLDHNAPDFPISKLEIENMIIPAIIKKFNE